MKHTPKRVVIVGGGNAGLSIAAQLRNRDKAISITVVDPSAKHYYQPAWTLVGAGVFDVKKTVRSQKSVIPKGVHWEQEAVSEFFPDENRILCESGKSIAYDALVVAPGIQLDWDKIEGFRATLGKNQVSSNYSYDFAPYTWEMIRNFKGGTAVFTNPVTPVKCGGAPHKIMYLACDYWRKQGILDKCDVHYISGAGTIFAVKEFADTLSEIVKDNRITPHYNCNTVAIDGKAKVVSYMENDANGQPVRKELKFDLCHAVPPQSAPDFLKRSPLADPNNPYGYVEINKNTMQHTRYANVFSAGDCTNAPTSKTGAAIRKQAPALVANLMAYLNGETTDVAYSGYTACPIPTHYGKLMLAEFDYSNKPKPTFPFDQTKPRWSMWVMKRRLLPWMYWNQILTGKA